MTSTFPTTRNNRTYFKNGLREIQSKRETLLALETTLKKRIDEFRQLCLKEGELTGQLPIDYPLQPREPIPQVRRRALSSNGVRYKQTASSSSSSSSNSSSTYPIAPVRSTPHINQHQQNYQHRLQNHPQQQVTTPNNTMYQNNHSHQSSVIKPFTNFQPYYEETKPFQMSDFYKYSSEHRLKSNGKNIMSNNDHTHHIAKPKTTRQLQDDVSKKNTHKFTSYDEQIQASVKLIEKSGQKLIEATAKAIAGNPGLAEKLNIMLPKEQEERY